VCVRTLCSLCESVLRKSYWRLNVRLDHAYSTRRYRSAMGSTYRSPPSVNTSLTNRTSNVVFHADVSITCFVCVCALLWRRGGVEMNAHTCAKTLYTHIHPSHTPTRMRPSTHLEQQHDLRLLRLGVGWVACGDVPPEGPHQGALLVGESLWRG
jgi:hypothetical protein